MWTWTDVKFLLFWLQYIGKDETVDVGNDDDLIDDDVDDDEMLDVDVVWLQIC